MKCTRSGFPGGSAVPIAGGLVGGSLVRGTAAIPASWRVIDAGQNNTADSPRERYAIFLDTFRRLQPQTPVLATTPIFYSAELRRKYAQAAGPAKREIIASAARRHQKEGDRSVFLLEAVDCLGPDFPDRTIDGLHADRLGFARMAEGMAPVWPPFRSSDHGQADPDDRSGRPPSFDSR